MVSLGLDMEDAFALLTWEFTQFLLDSSDCFVYWLKFLLDPLRVAVTIIVQVVPVVLKRILSINQQFQNAIDNGILMLRVLLILFTLIISDGVLETLLIRPAELLLDHAVLTILEREGLRFAGGEEQRPCQSALGLSH